MSEQFNTESEATEESAGGNGAVGTVIIGGIQVGTAATVATIHMAGRPKSNQ